MSATNGNEEAPAPDYRPPDDGEGPLIADSVHARIFGQEEASEVIGGGATIGPLMVQVGKMSGGPTLGPFKDVQVGEVIVRHADGEWRRYGDLATASAAGVTGLAIVAAPADAEASQLLAELDRASGELPPLLQQAALLFAEAVELLVAWHREVGAGAGESWSDHVQRLHGQLDELLSDALYKARSTEAG